MTGTLAMFRKISKEEISRKYLIESSSADEIIRIAAASGDELIICLLLEPAPLNDEEIQLCSEYQNYLESKAILERRLEMRSIQITIFKKFYENFRNDVLDHKEEIESELKYEMHNFLYHARLKNREYLKKTPEVFMTNKAVELNTQLRVQLHQKFSQKLEIEFASLDFEKNVNSLAEALQLYKMAQNDLNKTQNAIAILVNDNKRLQTRINNFNAKHSEINSIFSIKKTRILLKLFQQRFLHNTTLDDTTRLIGFSHKIIKVSYLEPITGNNLIHIACAHGQFELALFLIAKGVKIETKNTASIPAVDMQDDKGNTVVHYLILKGEYNYAINLLLHGASCNIKNHEDQTILDLKTEDGSLIHYLLKELNKSNPEQNYKELFLKLLDQNLNLSPLLIQNKESKTAYHVLLNLKDQKTKQAILNILINGNLAKSFHNSFENEINLSLWQHFKLLSRMYNRTLLIKILSKQNGIFFDNQLQFLSDLQITLDECSSNMNDFVLYSFLNKAFKENRITTTHWYKFYSKSSLYYDLQEKCNNKATEPSKKNTTSYLLLASSLGTHLHEMTNPPSSNKNECKQPIKNKIPHKCLDPLHWFPKTTTTDHSHNTIAAASASSCDYV
jgi:exonuclease VII small subunit